MFVTVKDRLSWAAEKLAVADVSRAASFSDRSVN
jgi:hypothetical protein